MPNLTTVLAAYRNNPYSDQALWQEHMRVQMRANLATSNYHSHYTRFSRSYSYLELRRNCKQLGELLREAIANNDHDEALSALNRFDILNDPHDLFNKHFAEIFSCNDCGSWFFENDEYHNVNNDYAVCESCSRHYHYSERLGYYMEHDDESCDHDGDRIINGYHESDHEHIPSTYDNRKPRVLLGLELEIEVDDDYSRVDKAAQLLNGLNTLKGYRYANAESDGSLDYGFEIISGFTGLDIHAQQLKYFDQRLIGMRSHKTDSCGLHIHICKSDMTTLHAAKMILFINDPQNDALIYSLARRRNVGYAKIVDKKNNKQWLKHALEYDRKGSQLCALNSDRYEALNFHNEKTIEFRLFRGSLKYQTIMSCLEFTFATWHFCRYASTNELTTANFLRFICDPENKRDTRFLRAYFVAKNILQLPANGKKAA